MDPTTESEPELGEVSEEATSKEAPVTPAIVLTRYASRYGVRNRGVFKNTGKSGLRPLELKAYPEEEKRQRAKELLETGCLENENVKPTHFDQSVPIHSMYQQTRWMTSTIPMDNGLAGSWDVKSNEEIWIVLQPSLRLAL
ncbi:hypothetical protein B7494_g8015 [Chlorociboria aeruginascens]|nr:hypothetical protein B7494_g8015 [Chlorociboria aeruginascens]